MAKKSSIMKNERRKTKALASVVLRNELRKTKRDVNLSMEQRFDAAFKLASMSRDTSMTRVRNRCVLTGRSRGYYRFFGVSRILLREMISSGLIPGARKASW